MHTVVLLLLAFFNSSILSQECSCLSQQLDNSNIKDYITLTNPFYKKIVSANLKNPVLKTNGCIGSMYCENQNALLLFDETGLGKLFGTETANGSCDTKTQTWNIDTGNGPNDPTSFEQLWGTCIVTGNCNCTAIALDNSNINNFVKANNPFYSTLASSAIRLPNLNISSCSASMVCESGYDLLLFDETGSGKLFEDPTVSGSCNYKTQTWKVDTGSQIRLTTFRQMYGVCIPNANSPSKLTTSLPSVSTTSSEFTCDPSGPKPFLFAYSNDLDPTIVQKSWEKLSQMKNEHPREFSSFGRARFDSEIQEPIEYLSTWSQLSDSVSSRLPNDSLSFANTDAGSDVYRVLQEFMNTTLISQCGATLILLVKRWPNNSEPYPSELVEKLKANKVNLYLLSATMLTGFTPCIYYQQCALYAIVENVYGLFLYDNEQKFPTVIEKLPLFAYPNIVFTSNTKREHENPPPMTIRSSQTYYFVLMLQRLGIPVNIDDIVFRWSSSQSSGSMKFDDNMRVTENDSNYITFTVDLKESVYNLSYNYTPSASHLNFQTRVYSSKYH